MLQRKRVRVILSPEAEEAYRLLSERSAFSKSERSLFSAINRKVELIKANPHYGDPMAKRLIPDEYVSRYGITNLFRVELPQFWRMLYTLTRPDGKEIEIIAFVLEISSHPDYDRRFGYGK